MENALLDIGRKFQGHNVHAVNLLNEQQKKGEEEFKRLGIELEDAKKRYMNSQIKNGPVFFLKPAITNTIRIVDDLRVKGQLPHQPKKIFTNDLLDRGKCICDTDLASDVDGKGNEKNIHRKTVEAVRDSLGENKGYDIGVEMKYHFEATTLGTLQEPKFDKFMHESFDVPRESYTKVRDQVKKRADENHELRLKLQAVGETDVTELVKEQEFLLARSGEIRDFIKEEEYTIKTKIKNISYNKGERYKLLSKNERTRKIAHEQKIWQILSDIFDTAFSDLKKEIREDVQEKTFETFKDLQYKEGEYLRFTIREDYTASLTDKDRHPALGSLSMGERLFLALSFISALKDATDYTFPLIIDTPLGRVSGTPRYLLSQALPKYLPDEQIIFLATNTEFLDPITNWSDEKIEESGGKGTMLEKEGHPEESFGQMLEKNINVTYYKIQREDGNTVIRDLVPKWRR
jgi:DNA sulfur modification protein DndD